jgi:hypothetical protein
MSASEGGDEGFSNEIVSIQMTDAPGDVAIDQRGMPVEDHPELHGVVP